jgi:hypothetical protein
MTTRPRSARKPLYSLHPAVAATREWVEDLPRRTGRSLEEWLALLESSGPAGEADRTEWLRRIHGLTTSAACWLAERSVGKGLEKSDPQVYLEAAPGYVDAMYSGAKAALRPLHERLIRRIQRLGPEVKICPCQGAVLIYRHRLIAQISPATRQRIDIGLALGDQEAGGRLAAGGEQERAEGLTHRVVIRKEADIDLELERWLRKAYELDAPAGPAA